MLEIFEQIYPADNMFNTTGHISLSNHSRHVLHKTQTDE